MVLEDMLRRDLSYTYVVTLLELEWNWKREREKKTREGFDFWFPKNGACILKEDKKKSLKNQRNGVNFMLHRHMGKNCLCRNKTSANESRGKRPEHLNNQNGFEFRRTPVAVYCQHVMDVSFFLLLFTIFGQSLLPPPWGEKKGKIIPIYWFC